MLPRPCQGSCNASGKLGVRSDLSMMAMYSSYKCSMVSSQTLKLSLASSTAATKLGVPSLGSSSSNPFESSFNGCRIEVSSTDFQQSVRELLLPSKNLSDLDGVSLGNEKIKKKLHF